MGLGRPDRVSVEVLCNTYSWESVHHVSQFLYASRMPHPHPVPTPLLCLVYTCTSYEPYWNATNWCQMTIKILFFLQLFTFENQNANLFCMISLVDPVKHCFFNLMWAYLCLLFKLEFDLIGPSYCQKLILTTHRGL